MGVSTKNRKQKHGKGHSEEYREPVEKYLAIRAILISTAYNEPNIIMGRSLRRNETIRVRLAASSSFASRGSTSKGVFSMGKENCVSFFSFLRLLSKTICNVRKKEKRVFYHFHLLRLIMQEPTVPKCSNISCYVSYYFTFLFNNYGKRGLNFPRREC